MSVMGWGEKESGCVNLYDRCVIRLTWKGDTKLLWVSGIV